MLKTKLEEAQKGLEANAQMILYLNKQLNEKPGSSLLSGSKHYPMSSKPPIISTTAGASSTFKPSFTTID